MPARPVVYSPAHRFLARFERGVDWHLQRKAMERCDRSVIEIVGVRPGPVMKRSTRRRAAKLNEVTYVRAHNQMARHADEMADERVCHTVLAGLHVNGQSG